MKLAEDVVKGFWGVWVSAHGTFNDRQSQTPNVTLYTVCSSARRSGLLHATSRDSLGGHVTLTTNVRLGDAGNEVATDTKVANLDLALAVDENIRGLHIAMNNVVIVLQ